MAWAGPHLPGEVREAHRQPGTVLRIHPRVLRAHPARLQGPGRPAP